MDAYLDFEKPIATLEKKLTDLRELSKQQGVDLKSEIQALEKKVNQLIRETYNRLTPWQRVQLSRHPNRPYSRDYIENLFPSFMELHGDRIYSDDRAIMAGVALWPPTYPKHKNQETAASKDATPIMVIGHQKGRTTKQKMLRNFGMAKPEGYRKAMRLMDLAERSRMPVLTFVDTPGAYPGIETEERGQAQAIAESITKMFQLTVPVFTVILGEGGSGGALAIASADRVYMLEYSTYSVISPEGCASILWSDSKLAPRAAEVLKISPKELQKLGVIDGIIPEPIGGAHRNWEGTFKETQKFLVTELDPVIQKNARIEAKDIAKTAASGAGKKKGKGQKSKKGSKTGTKANQKKGTLEKASARLAFRNQRMEKFRKMGSSALGKTSGASQ